MSRFEDRLLAELLEQHGAVLAEPPARPLPTSGPARPRLRLPVLRLPVPRLLPAGAAALALAAALVAVVIGFGSGGGGGGTPAYAVVQNGDGTVTVTVREIQGINGANQQLRTLGVHATAVRSERSCATRRGQYKTAGVSADLSHRIASGSTAAGVPSVVIDPSAIPPHDTVVIGVRAIDTHGGPAATGLEIGIYEGSVPPCLKALGSD